MLFIDGTNRDIAVQWLNLSDKNKIDYVAYFVFDSIVVCDYEIHTGETDFRFLIEFKAAVTLGNGLTKDDFVQQTYHYVSKEIKDVVLKQLKDYGGTKQCLSQLLDEEHQRELEQELEEKRSPPVTTCQPILHEEIKQLYDMHSSMMNLKQHPIVFRHLPYAFTGTTFVNDC
ncbi:unnamed protein product [Rotaria sordida]|uniref:Uncharacterized protein n=2 Tax=Rotaria sordida TaxID=392033 RepID=A0A814LJA0_9BILA|nr:unnamed protein product [Rotaria sordida]CAF3644687.1 unnamed protein product [Rotaria sordida]CAF3983701.1 unnamed protein product [Rotaria sordida]